MHSRPFVLRTLMACLAIGALAVFAASCSSGDDSSSDTTPTIQFETPAGSPSSAATSAPSSEPSSVAASSTAGASSTASSSSTAAGGGSAATTIDISAKDTKFDKSTITVPAGQQITVKFTNDDNIVHNFAVYDKKDGNELFTGDLFKGPDVTKTETFTAPATPGNYYFQCDVHPDQMNGTLVVQ